MTMPVWANNYKTKQAKKGDPQLAEQLPFDILRPQKGELRNDWEVPDWRLWGLRTLGRGRVLDYSGGFVACP